MQYIKIFLSTALTVFAFMFDRVYAIKGSWLAQLASAFAQLARRSDYVDTTWCALAVFIFIFYWKSWERHEGFRKIEAAFAVLFSVLMLIGRSFSVYDSLKMLASQKLLTLFAGIGWFIFFYMLLSWVSCFVEERRLSVEKPDDYHHIQLIAFTVILLCWLPQWLLCLPGNVHNDGMPQLCQWFGYTNPTDHHPWFMTAILGFLMSIGRNFSDNAGILVIVLFQFTFCAWAYSQVCMVVASYAGKKSFYLTGLFFAIVPVWGLYASTVVKDTLATAIFVLYFCSFLDIFEGGKKGWGKWLKFGLISLLVCLSRHEGIYIVLFAGIALFFSLRTGRMRLVCVLVVICVCVFGYNILIFNVLGVARGHIREMLSIPFQQTARYSRDHFNDISNDERNIINKVLPYDELASLYKPESSDPVKAKMGHVKNEDLRNYFFVWAKMGLRHPGIYLQAAINNTYKYYYPFCKVAFAYIMNIPKKSNKGLNIYYTATSPKKRKSLRTYNDLWTVAPGVSLLLNTGVYTWIVLVGILLLLKKRKYRELVVFSPLITRIAICCASPVNGYLRYAMPLMACTPVLLAWLAHTLCSVEGDDNG